MKINKDFVFRILKTFVQAVIGALIVSLKDGVDFTSKEAIGSLIVGLIAAGLSAVMNIPKLKGEDDEIQ